MSIEQQLINAFDLVSKPDSQLIKQGESILSFLKKRNDYPLALLLFMNNQGSRQQEKLRAAIQLKLWCEYYQKNYYSSVIEDVKSNILLAYLHFQLRISKTIRPAIIFLTKYHFPHKWDNLILNLLKFAQQFPDSLIAVLKLIQSITHRYGIESRSDELYEQIIKVCDQTHDFLLNVTQGVLFNVQNQPNNLHQVLMLKVLLKIFYNLNYQDLHPKFQDNVFKWMAILKSTMNLNNISQQIFSCKGAALQAILLYANKYKDDAKQSIQGFTSQIWKLCSNATQDSQYDNIVQNCLKFFRSVILWQQMKPYFTQNMGEVIKNLIIPNICMFNTMRQLFHDQPVILIDYYFRNCQIQTRRASALQLLRTICRHFDNCFQNFLLGQLQTFSQYQNNVNAQCTILTLIIDGSSKGFRDIEGCTQLFVNRDIIIYTYENIVKRILGNINQYLMSGNGTIQQRFDLMHVLLTIRFLFYFRIYIPQNQINGMVNFLTLIKTKNYSLSKVIYLAINGFLIMKHGNFQYYKDLTQYYNSDRIIPLALDIYQVIYNGTISQPLLEESLTKMLLNVTKILAHRNSQYYPQQIQIVKQMFKRTANFNFQTVAFLFEAIGYIVYWNIKTNSNIQGLQSEIFIFLNKSMNERSDLINFCLQILAIIINQTNSNNNQYLTIYTSLLQPMNWGQENISLMSSYIQYLISFISKHKQRLFQDKNSIQIILSKIIQIDHVQLFYRFIQTIMLNFSLQDFYQSGYLKILIQGSNIFARSSISGQKSALLFLCKMIVFYGTNINQYTSSYFDQLLEVSGNILRTISIRKDRKLVFHAICSCINDGYFQNIQANATYFNCLISNTAQRYNIKNISAGVNEKQVKQKKQSTYRKLMVFKQFQIQQKQSDVDQQKLLVMSFKNFTQINGEFINLIQPKNRERIMRLADKY